MTVKRRNITIDIMKGLLIMSVVIGHSHWPYRNIFFWFHMPVFFLISGYLLRIPNKGDEKQWLFHKCKNLMIPYICYAFTLGLFEIRYGIGKSLLYWIRCLYGGKVIAGVYWFITVLFLSEIIIVFIDNRIHNIVTKRLIYFAMYLAAIAESVLFIPSDTAQIPVYLKLPWDLDVCLFAIPYISLGIEIRQKSDSVFGFLKTTKGIILILLSTLFLCIGLYFLDAVSWFTLDMKNSQYKIIVLDLFTPIIFALFVWLISKSISGTILGKVLAYIGRQSLIIMYLHIIIRDKIVTRLLGDQYSIVLYLLFVLTVCSGWNALIGRIPKVSVLFGIKTYRSS